MLKKNTLVSDQTKKLTDKPVRQFKFKNNELMRRILTGAILLPLVVMGILFLPAAPLEIIIAFIFSLAIWEWTRLSGFEKTSHRIGIFSVILLTTVLFNYGILLIISNYSSKIFSLFLFLILLFWLWIIIQIKLYPLGKTFLSKHWVNILLGAIILGPAFLVMGVGIQIARSLLLYLLFIVWFADIGAYFVGKKMGKHKLAPQVSPGKTWEGVLGGLAASWVVITLGYFGFNNKDILVNGFQNFALNNLHFEYNLKTALWFATGFITAIFSIVGDLFISLLKRNRQLKDTGSLLPGHGGILDRIDGLIASLTIFMVLTLLLPP